MYSKVSGFSTSNIVTIKKFLADDGKRIILYAISELTRTATLKLGHQ